MTRAEVYCCSTLLSLATAVVAGDLDKVPAGGDGARRVLLVADYAPEAETGRPLLSRPGTAALTGCFDEVVDVNDLLAPYHPGAFTAGEAGSALLGRLLTERWGLVGEVGLVVEPYQVTFARWVLQLFPDAPVTVVADGLMAYGPTREKVPVGVGRRLVELAHLDLVPGLVPVYLSEHGVPARPLPNDRVRAVLDRLADPGPDPMPVSRPAALVLGQYLAAQLYADAAVRATGPDRSTPVAFKPHPAASPLAARGVQQRAAAQGVTVELLGAAGPAEALFGSGRYRSVHGCFSTGLFTATELYGLEAEAVGTDRLLARLSPFPNSNRVPVVLADLLLRRPAPGEPRAATRAQQASGVVGAVVAAVSYAMQPELYPGLRPAADDVLAAHPRWRDRYVRRRRLTTLGLPGASVPRPPRPAPPLRRRFRRRLVRVVRRLAPAPAR